jgi:hypothetical protein
MGFNLCGRVLVRAEGATCLTELMAPIDAPFGNNLPAFPLLVLVLLNEHVQVSSSIHVQKIRKAWVSRSAVCSRLKVTTHIWVPSQGSKTSRGFVWKYSTLQNHQLNRTNVFRLMACFKSFPMLGQPQTQEFYPIYSIFIASLYIYIHL